MAFETNQRRSIAEADAQKFLSQLPANIRTIVERLPFGARWMLAATIGEVQSKQDVYNTGIAIGMITGASARDEISSEQMETLALYVGKLCPHQLITK
ncbi:hypothetical protein [Pseudomonas syringae]|uniref:hypothetical protein n=1 Tax=Pseudomonas syringae TaxID=317 RepID=UPI0019568B3D|nr:hypothetical protein [Pseudomonas syringae]